MRSVSRWSLLAGGGALVLAACNSIAGNDSHDLAAGDSGAMDAAVSPDGADLDAPNVMGADSAADGSPMDASRDAAPSEGGCTPCVLNAGKLNNCCVR